MQEGLISKRDFTRRFGIGLTKLQELIKAGQLDARRVDGKVVITESSAQRWVASLPRAFPDAPAPPASE